MRITRAVLRVLAFVLLALLMVGVPMMVFRLVGVPVPGAAQLRGAWQHRQIDGDLVVRIGAAIFAVLWLWFAITALAELWHVIAWRVAGQGARLAPLPPGPSGAVRALVRFILVSSVAATATFGNFVPLARATVSAPVTRPDAAAVLLTSASTTTLRSTTTHLAIGRETPFSLAATLGRAELRETIIELNHGRVGPNGMAWQGGVFPAGMEVTLPDEQVVLTPLGFAHEVVSGDSYWGIAGHHLSATLGHEVTDPEVMEYTESLISMNHQLLGHRDPALILPGELVIFTTVGNAAPVNVSIADAQHPEVSVPDMRLEVPATDTVVEPAVQPAVQPPVEPAVQPAVELVPPIVPTQPAAPSLVRRVERLATEHDGVLPYSAGLGCALMMSAGAIALLDSRRRRELRSATAGSRLLMPSSKNAHTELLLRSLDASERLARLDLALRSAAPSLAAQSASVFAAMMYDTGDVCLFLRGSAAPALAEWKLDLHANTWRLSGTTSLGALAESARLSAQPCPAMLHVGGVAEGGELFVDLEAVGTFVVHSPHSPAILRCMAASLAVSSFLDATRIFTVGLGEVAAGSTNSESVDSLDAALDAATMSLGSTGQLAFSASTFALRVAGSGGEAWEPSVVVALVDEGVEPLDGVLRSVATGGRGLAVVLGTEESSDPMVALASTGWSLRFENGAHRLEPLGLTVQPVGVSEADVAALSELLASTALTCAPLDEIEVLVRPFDAALAVAEAAPYAERQWALMVSVLGQVGVTSVDGATADCERSKATELIVWLSQHRERPTRSAARTALWDLDVRDATFANVVSDARRAMARAIGPPSGEEWIARTLTETLPLHESVVTDAELLAARVEYARGMASLDAIRTLRPGVDLLAGLPFAGTSYLWTDAEGITSSLILLATGAAIELANHYLLLGDVDGVFWATGQGLKVLNGHEELISLRMRAHARCGNLSGVRGEWESYERAIAADPWTAAEPAPKLVALRRELLTPSHSRQEAWRSTGT